MFAVFGVTEESVRKQAQKSVKDHIGRGKARRLATAEEQKKMLSDALDRLANGKAKMKILTIEYSSPSIASVAIPLLEQIGCRNLQVYMKTKVEKISKSKRLGSTVRTVMVWKTYNPRMLGVMEADA